MRRVALLIMLAGFLMICLPQLLGSEGCLAETGRTLSVYVGRFPHL